MIVVDATVVVNVVGDDEHAGSVARARLAGESLVAPHLVDLEVMSVLRRLVALGQLPARRAERALDNLRALALTRVPHPPLLPRIWELRDNLSPYDAAYVALAELLDAPLLTGDRRLARAPGSRCRIELIG